ncbi:MAG: RNA methyltransferase [Allobaculum sp.]|nr:RNA methyltransferase [Allobaculum sp.]
MGMKIESPQNQTIKSLAKLSSKKQRDETGQFLVEGWHLVQEAQRAGCLEHVYQLENLPTLEDIKTSICTQAVLNKLSSQKSDAKYIGVCHKPTIEKPLLAFSKVLLLDRLQDPGNVGALIRSAYSFGIEAIVLSNDCADPYGPKTIQSSQGALFHLPLFQTDLLEAIEILKRQDVPVFGAALHQKAIRLHELNIPTRFGLVIGNEGQGISQEVLKTCSECIYIQMASFESLNAAIAGSILMNAR